MNKTKTNLKRWRIDIARKLDLDEIRRVANEVTEADLASGGTHGLLLHEVHTRAGRTEIVASMSAAGTKGIAQRLGALGGGSKVKITAARG